jgi:hypothetical protein
MKDLTKENLYRYQIVMDKFHADSRNISIDWANNVLKNKEKYLVIDVKIANRRDKEIMGIKIGNIDGVKILDVMFRPQGNIDKHILSEIKASGLNLDNLPMWEDKISELKYLETKILLSETWEHDELAFYSTTIHYGREDLSLQGIDVGKIYSMYKGNWDNYNCKYHRQWIPSKIPGGTDRCRDLIAAIELIANEDNIS